MSRVERGGVFVQQCLFGYEDGHRLLAASIELASTVENILLEYTDLDPGAAFSDDGYLTGVPLPAQRAYAFMRTWFAPEMPRPGCVWTHVILIQYTDIARVSDLRQAAELFRRPEKIADVDAYKRALELPAYVEPIHYSVSDPDLGLRAIDALYGDRPRQRLQEVSSTAASEIILDLWAQQWPRLRRSFSFRTAGEHGQSGRLNRTFDLQVSASDEGLGSRDVGDLSSRWKLLALMDLGAGPLTDFRRFLRRYGSDVKQGRRRFKYLAELYLDLSEDLSTERMFALLDGVAEALPDPSDGTLLKRDLLSSGESNFSMLPALDPLHLMSYLVNEEGASAFPPPSEKAVSLISDLWSMRAEEILMLAEQAMSSDSNLAEALLYRLAGLVDPEDFFEKAAQVPLVRTKLVELRPDLMDAAQLIDLSVEELSGLLPCMSQDDSDLAERVIRRLLRRQSHEIAALMWRRFPLLLQQVLMDELKSVGTLQHVAKAWLDVARIATPESLLQALQMAHGSAAKIAACVLLSDGNLELAKKIDMQIWSAVVAEAEEDVVGEARLSYLAFLFAVALDRPSRGVEILFERSFELVHQAVMHSRLPYSAFNAIARRVPTLPFWQAWDSCLRLRLAVVDAYLSHGLDSGSFGRLSKDKYLMKQLREMAVTPKSMRNL